MFEMAPQTKYNRYSHACMQFPRGDWKCPEDYINSLKLAIVKPLFNYLSTKIANIHLATIAQYLYLQLLAKFLKELSLINYMNT